MEKFSPNDLQKKLGTVFNSVQSSGEVLISSRSRPKMILMLATEKESLIEKVKQLTALVKAQ